MFSGYGLYREGQIFGLVCDSMLYLKTDKQSEPAFKTEGCRQFTYEAKSKVARMSYWSAPDVFFDNQDNIRHWAEMAYQAGLRSSKKKKAM